MWFDDSSFTLFQTDCYTGVKRAAEMKACVCVGVMIWDWLPIGFYRGLLKHSCPPTTWCCAAKRPLASSLSIAQMNWLVLLLNINVSDMVRKNK